MSGFDDRWRSKGEAARSLSLPARRAHQEILSAFVTTGGPPNGPALDRILGADGLDPATVRAELAERDVVAFGPDGAVVAAYPFSPGETGIRVRWDGGPEVFAMCAIDALGISAMLGHGVAIDARDPVDGASVRVRVHGDDSAWDPTTAVVLAGIAVDTCCSSVDDTCSYVNFFATPVAAQAWAAEHDGITCRILSQGQALAMGIAEFGDLMRGCAERRR